MADFILTGTVRATDGSPQTSGITVSAEIDGTSLAETNTNTSGTYTLMVPVTKFDDDGKAIIPNLRFSDGTRTAVISGGDQVGISRIDTLDLVIRHGQYVGRISASELTADRELAIRERTNAGTTFVEIDFVSPRYIKVHSGNVTISGDNVELPINGYTFNKSVLAGAELSDIVDVFAKVKFISSIGTAETTFYSLQNLTWTARSTETQVTIRIGQRVSGENVYAPMSPFWDADITTNQPQPAEIEIYAHLIPKH